MYRVLCIASILLADVWFAVFLREAQAQHARVEVSRLQICWASHLTSTSDKAAPGGPHGRAASSRRQQEFRFASSPCRFQKVPQLRREDLVVSRSLVQANMRTSWNMQVARNADAQVRHLVRRRPLRRSWFAAAACDFRAAKLRVIA